MAINYKSVVLYLFLLAVVVLVLGRHRKPALPPAPSTVVEVAPVAAVSEPVLVPAPVEVVAPPVAVTIPPVKRSVKKAVRVKPKSFQSRSPLTCTDVPAEAYKYPAAAVLQVARQHGVSGDAYNTLKACIRG